ncbi:hypothetical protein B566_EDAN002309 [Ephemera danica]|nr:hypothetical protein B566_EDAN002309 [Ephemera danica]
MKLQEMVKPTPAASERQSINSGAPASMALSDPDTEDLSFVIVSSSDESPGRSLVNGNTSNGSRMPSLAFSHNLTGQSVENASTLLPSGSMAEFTVEDIQKKLQDLLKENINLKDILQQNNLAMKQQMNTLVAWQEEVAVLKAENAKLKKFAENNDKIQTENDELKQRVAELEKSVPLQEDVLKEYEMLKCSMVDQSHQVKRMQEALERAEQRVLDQMEEQKRIKLERDELLIRVELLNTELQSTQKDGYVMVSEQASIIPELSLESEPKSLDEKLPFPQSMDRFEKKLMKTLKHLVQQADSFSKLNKWLLDAQPSGSTSSMDVVSLNVKLDQLTQRLNETETRSTVYRSRLEEARFQLGKLASDFQELHEEWLKCSKEKVETQHSSTTHLEAQSQGFKEQLDRVQAELLQAQEKIKETVNSLVIQKELVTQRDHTLAQLNTKLEQQNTVIAKNQDELKQYEKKINTLEQKIEGLTAQAEVYKMDFNEERESREKLATEKEKIVDDLKTLQRRNQKLLEEVEEYKGKLSQTPNQQNTAASSTSGNSETKRTPLTSIFVGKPKSKPLLPNSFIHVSSSSRFPSGFNTIATPGRNRNRQEESQESLSTVPFEEVIFEDEIPMPKEYFCPKCNAAFRKVEPLQYHVETLRVS